MAPAVPETPDGVKAIRLGVLELARLKRLKISARNSSPRLSRNAISFSTEKSQVAIEPTIRSEERRVGKECRYRWARHTEKKNKENKMSSDAVGTKLYKRCET